MMRKVSLYIGLSHQPEENCFTACHQSKFSHFSFLHLDYRHHGYNDTLPFVTAVYVNEWQNVYQYQHVAKKGNVTSVSRPS